MRGKLSSGLLAVSLVAVVLTGCGYAGEPKPPALKRPLRVSDLTIAERGSKIVVTFKLPKETTEGLPIDTPPEIDMRAGPQPSGEWTLAEWEGHSERVSVPELQIPQGGLEPEGRARNIKPTRAPRGSSGATTPAQPPGVLKKIRKTKATYAPVPAEYFQRTVNIDAAKYSSHIVVVGVRIRGPLGRDDGWSFIQLAVLPVLPVPMNLHPSNAANAVRLEWSVATPADAPGFRVYRKLAADTDWVLIGDSPRPSFDDPAPAYGKPAQYYVESFRKSTDGVMASDPSATISFTAEDRFPPAVPANLAAIVGTKTVELVWDRVEDPDLAGYRVYRDGKRIADAVVTPAFSDKDVVAATKYQYRVSAVDQSGNESAQSAPVDVATE